LNGLDPSTTFQKWKITKYQPAIANNGERRQKRYSVVLLRNYDRSLLTHAVYKPKSNVSGWIQSVLGHENGASAGNYQRFKIINFKKPFTYTPRQPPDFLQENMSGVKKAKAVRALMAKKERITAAAIKREGGGDMNAILKWLKYPGNVKLIEEYHASL